MEQITDLEKLDKEIWAKATPEELDHYRNLCKVHRTCETIMATNTTTGEREEYRFAEHANLGPGWMMMRVDKPWLGIVASTCLTDIEAFK